MFRDRTEAGQRLAKKLVRFRGQPDVLVLGLARGGVVVARAVADALGVPVDVLLVRKLGVPSQPELGFGAVAEGSGRAAVRVLNADLIRECKLSPAAIDRIAAREEQEIGRRSRIYRGARPPAEVRGRRVIVVDDGLATGSTMIAAVRALRERKVGRIVVAVPIGPPSACEDLRAEADEVVCLHSREPFGSVSFWYDDFSQVDDRAVKEALRPRR